jgi:BirA family biotin operon repressor/biotin-[acetyl-CoA-carboxylase] ligase
MTTPALPGFFQPVYLDATDSTNDEAKRRARSGAPEGTLIWAGAQSAGRGRQGKSWFSPPGNLYLSLVLRPRCDVAQAAQLSFAAALAVGDACRGLLPAGAGLAYKWPNDVLVSGKKVAGILLESQAAGGKTLDFLVIGIGINLVSHPKDTAYPATSLKSEGACAVTPATMLEALAPALILWYERWGAEGFEPLRRAWLDQAFGLGSEIRAQLPQAELTGRFAGLDADGALLLETAGGARRIAAADIFPAS